MKRIIFWLGFVAILGLMIWGLIVAFNRSNNTDNSHLGTLPPVSETDHIIGATGAPITVIEYSDFECPACESYYYFVSKLVSEASSTIRVVYRHFPLPQHANAMLAAQASEAATIQGKFTEMYDELFRNNNEWTSLSDPHSIFEGYASKIGLNVAQFRLDIDSVPVKNKVIAARNEAESLGINYTPTFFVNGKVIQNTSNYEQFKKNIESAASAGKQ